MSETETLVIIISIVVGILILAGGTVWGISTYARAQRRIHSGRNEEYHPPSSLPQSQEHNLPAPGEHAGIRWGNTVENNTLEIEPGRFGNTEQIEYEYTAVTPYSDSPIVKCPICQTAIDERQNNAIVCPGCQESYHLHCWQLTNNRCPICGHKEQ